MLLAQVFVCFSLFLSVCALCYTVETKNLFCCLRRFSFVSLCFFLSVLCTTQSKLKTCYVACAGFCLFLSVSLCFSLSVLCATQSKLKTCSCCLRRFSFVSLCFFLSVLCTTQSKLKTCYCCLRRLLSVSLCVCVCLSVSVCVCVCLRLSGFVYLCLYNIYIYSLIEIGFL